MQTLFTKRMAFIYFKVANAIFIDYEVLINMKKLCKGRAPLFYCYYNKSVQYDYFIWVYSIGKLKYWLRMDKLRESMSSMIERRQSKFRCCSSVDTMGSKDLPICIRSFKKRPCVFQDDSKSDMTRYEI